jgi:hypothetical protein
MATVHLKLEEHPAEPRSRELWLQHAAGLIVFEDARQYAIDQMDITLDNEVKAEIIKGIDNAIYGLMMIFDGVSGHLKGSEYSVKLETKVVLSKNNESGKDIVIDQIDLKKGDGMCVGYHGWLEGDFGKDPVASRK